MRNWLTAGIALLVAFVVFVGNLALTRAMRPDTVDVLAAARPLPAGARITEQDLTTVQVYRDDRAALYLPADQVQDVVGGYALRDFAAGEPLVRAAVLAPGGDRTVALLAEHPDRAVFPLPLDASNVIAGAPASYLPGDIVGITVVFPDQPQEPPQQRQEVVGVPPFYAAPGAQELATPTPTPTPTPVIPPYEERGYPPLARSLTLNARVVQVTGLPPEVTTAEDAETAAVFAATSQEEPYLWVLIPAEDIELLTLALSSGEVYVYLSHPEAADRPGGFSYWDFLARIRTEREMATPSGTPVLPPTTPTPTASAPRPSATPTP